jgi:hypothetical protein
MSFVIIFSWQRQENYSGNAELMTLANIVAPLLDVIECKVNVSIVISATIRIVIATSTDNYYKIIEKKHITKHIANYQLTFHNFASISTEQFVATLGLYALLQGTAEELVQPLPSARTASGALTWEMLLDVCLGFFSGEVWGS